MKDIAGKNRQKSKNDIRPMNKMDKLKTELKTSDTERIMQDIEMCMKHFVVNSTYVSYGSGSKRKNLRESLGLDYKGYSIVIEIIEK